MEKIYYDFMLLSSIIVFLVVRRAYKSVKAASFVSKLYGEYTIEIRLYRILYFLLFLSSIGFMLYSLAEFINFISK